MCDGELTAVEPHHRGRNRSAAGCIAAGHATGSAIPVHFLGGSPAIRIVAARIHRCLPAATDRRVTAILATAAALQRADPSNNPGDYRTPAGTAGDHTGRMPISGSNQ